MEATNTILFVLSKSPDQALASESLDALMTAVLLNQQASALFTGGGLRQLHGGETREKLEMIASLGPVRFIVAASELATAIRPDIPAEFELEQLEESQLPELFSAFNKVLSF